MERQRKAYIYALCAITAWSTVASAFKISLRYLSSVELVLYASFVSALTYFITLVLQGRLPEVRDITASDLWHSAYLGFLNPFLYYFILFKAYSILPAQEALPLNLIWPIVLVLLSIPLLKQKVSVFSIFAFLVSFAGVFVIATRGDLLSFRFSDPLGVGLATGSSVIWALFWIGNVKDKRRETPKLFLNFVFGFAYCLIAAAFMGELRLPPWQGLAGAVYVGLFETGVTYIFWLKALQYSTSAERVSILVYIVPFTSMTVIALVIGETILMSSIIGAVLIVFGILLQKWLKRRVPVR